MPNNMERFNQQARQVLILAQEAAEKFGHRWIGTAHLLLALIRQEEGTAAQILRDLLDPVDVEEIIQRMPSPEILVPVGQAHLQPELQETIKLAFKKAERMGSRTIGTEHLLFALTMQGKTEARDILGRFNITTQEIENKLNRMLQDPNTLLPQLQTNPARKWWMLPYKDLLRNLGLTQKAVDVLAYAYDIAKDFHHDVDTGDLLWALIKVEGTVARHVLNELDVDAEQLVEQVTQLSSIKDMDDALKQMFSLAASECQGTSRSMIATEHLLSGIFLQTQNKAIQIITTFGITREALIEKVRQLLETPSPLAQESSPLSRVEDKETDQPIAKPSQIPIMPDLPKAGPKFRSNKMERFTQRARRVLSLAQEEAERMKHSYVGTEHLLIGLMREDGGVAGRVLRDLGLDQRRVEELVERMSRAGIQTQNTRLDLSPGTKKVFEMAVDEARRMSYHYIGTEHLLLGLVRMTEGVAIEVLKRLNVRPEEVRRQTRRVLQESPAFSPTKAAEHQVSFPPSWRDYWDYVIRDANHVAQQLKQNQIDTEHILLVLVMQDLPGSRNILRGFGMQAEPVKAIVEQMNAEHAKPVQTDAANASVNLYDIPIEQLDLSVRAYNTLLREKILTVGAVIDKMNQEGGLLAIRNFGQHTLAEVITKLDANGYLPPTSEYYLLDFSPELIQVFGLALAEALRKSSVRLLTEHLLIGLVKQGDNKAVQIMKQLGISPEAVEQAARQALMK